MRRLAPVATGSEAVACRSSHLKDGGKALAAQYDAFCPIKDTCVHGALTLGENIGDLNGISVAYAAYHLSLKGKPAPIIDGVTGDLRFFMA